jgi:thiol peroxidase
MATERFGLIQTGGKDAAVIGDAIEVGQTAPDFSAHALDWSIVHGLAGTKGKVRIIAAVPSLDTDTCDRETRRFNQEAANLSKERRILRRAVFVIDRQDHVTYVAYMPALA